MANNHNSYIPLTAFIIEISHSVQVRIVLVFFSNKQQSRYFVLCTTCSIDSVCIYRICFVCLFVQNYCFVPPCQFSPLLFHSLYHTFVLISINIYQAPLEYNCLNVPLNFCFYFLFPVINSTILWLESLVLGLEL